ncbi:MAG: shikimate dehydrogenase [Deltaproteobacteria bacterium]|nr:shikimate dehydrogenase [Deltaproteobacteria bacterium]
MNISGSTKLIAIFGDPIIQTLSPTIQNAALEFRSLDCVYIPFHVKAENLEVAIRSIPALDMLGANITIPHKEEALKIILSLGGEVDKEALEIGAVNTIVNKNGLLCGYNTDGEGYVRNLTSEVRFNIKDKKILLLGAGGAARSMLYATLKREPHSVMIANRTVEHAVTLKEDIGQYFNDPKILSSSIDDAADFSKTADLVINSTSIGMMGMGGEAPPIDVSLLSENAVVSDIVYKPLMTPLLTQAKARNLKIHNGLGMLVHQGALGFELWTGEKAPIDTMHFATIQIITQLDGKQKTTNGESR